MNIEYFITSDNHFGHFNVIRLCNRPFQSLEHMNTTMIMNWNSAVGKNDIVYHLGDLFWSERSAFDILPQLNGEIYLLLGNHDKRWKKIRNRLQKSPFNSDSNLIVEERDILEIKEPLQAVLCHYPLMSWNRAVHGVWHFCGHTHSNFNTSERKRVNVCVENTDYTPINLSIFKDKKDIDEVRALNNLFKY